MPKIKVAAYCRISSFHEEQESSLDLQKTHYEHLIQSNSNWVFAGIYADKATGTQTDCRPEFNRLIRDCKKCMVDLILTKSLSRFGRNTLNTLKIAYELFNIGVKVEFDKEKINNYNKEMRFAMAMYAAIAQEESKNMSNNIKWGISQRMRAGKVMLNCTRFLGYDKDSQGNLIVVEKEASIVKKIFELYLKGFGVRRIKKYLEENHIQTVTGKEIWSTSTIDRILSNEKYVGDVLMQKSFTEDFLTGKRRKNTGELDMYFIENNHEAIISREMFDDVQRKKNLIYGE
ncbi:MAG: recombinase family protein [Oscillospiraceae bacterium]